MKTIKRFHSTLSSSLLKVTLASTLKQKPLDHSQTRFGTIFSDHMLEIDWSESSGWSAPEIKPYQLISIDPASSVFHYCTECYEGLKVYRKDSQILTFRPELNMNRFISGADAAGLPMADPSELLKSIISLIKLDRDWVPREHGYSLYVRPVIFGTHAQLSVSKPKTAKILVIMSPVGPYFPSGLKPIGLLCDDTVVRAWPGGVGHKKLGGNYAPGVVFTENAKELGYNQMLWLVDRKVTESGVMNFFVVVDRGTHLELVTSPVNYTTLPGITRDSVLELAKEEGNIKVSEKEYTIDELVDWIDTGKVVEAFGTGTSAVVCPINSIGYNGKKYLIPTKLGNIGEVAKHYRDLLLDIKHGKIAHKWNYYID